jgi:D-xylulose reductase
MEPLSVAVHSVAQLGGFKTGQKIAVFGAGPVGLLCMAVARALGASRVIAVDIVEARLNFAAKWAGADVFLPPKLQGGEKRIEFSKCVVEDMKNRLQIEERGVNAIDVVIDASGAEVCIQMGLFLVKYSGTFVQVTDSRRHRLRITIQLNMTGWNGILRSDSPNAALLIKRTHG